MTYQKNSSKKRKSTPVKKKIFLESFEKNFGVIAPALKDAGITRGSYRNWLMKDEKFKTQVEDIKEMSLDFVESQIYKNIKEGKETSLIFYLKCRGKHRGWIEKQEINQNINYNQPLQLNIIPPDHYIGNNNSETPIDITPKSKKLNDNNDR